MPCAAPSEAVAVEVSVLIGLLAENFIGQEYLRHRKRTSFFPASLQDFQDISILFGNRALHVGFLIENNPTKFKPKIGGAPDPSDSMAVDAEKMKVPDLLNHVPERAKSPERAEYYEIKPNSKAGRAAGRKKLKSLEEDYGKLGIPYIRGKVWAVDKKVRIHRGNIFGFDVEAFFHYLLLEDGLIVYEICIEGTLLTFLAVALILGIIAAIIIIIINRGRVPDTPPQKPPELPVPKPVPVPIPTPEPVPVPVPAFYRPLAPGSQLALSDEVKRLLPRSPIVKSSIGSGGANHPDEVSLVQLLLNDWLAHTNQKILTVDGVFGPETGHAILSFQQVYRLPRDGRVDPDGPTLKMLLAVHLRSLFEAVVQSKSPFLYQSVPALQYGAVIDRRLLFERYFGALARKSVQGLELSYG
jgi:hypothetical protein